jgi:hypothetical protein
MKDFYISYGVFCFVYSDKPEMWLFPRGLIHLYRKQSKLR